MMSMMNTLYDRNLLLCKTKKRDRNGSSKVKTKRISYDCLYDGVHPSPDLYRKWYNYLCNSICKDLENERTNTESNHNLDNSLDFKRHNFTYE